MVVSINARDPIHVAQKLSSQSVAAQVVMQDDDELQVPLEHNKRYGITGAVGFHLSGILSGYRFRIVAPAGSLLSCAMAVFNCVLGTCVNAGIMGPGDPELAGGLASVGDHWLQIAGQVEIGDEDGLLKFQFAQNVSDAAVIRILRTSFLQVIDFGG